NGCDRIVVAANGTPYRETLSLVGGRHSGNGYRPFVIQGNGAILDGTQPIPAAGWEVYRPEIYRCTPRLKAHQQVFLDGLPARERAAAAGEGLPDLEPLEWCLY